MGQQFTCFLGEAAQFCLKRLNGDSRKERQKIKAVMVINDRYKYLEKGFVMFYFKRKFSFISQYLECSKVFVVCKMPLNLIKGERITFSGL